ncbi:MAG TPA: hypothetical protein VN326_18380 [Casimicrobiaceae bacterium]|jgi:hypothetical protein|nr:hypothetical protein [Casimicrobiaceae bacterium]
MGLAKAICLSALALFAAHPLLTQAASRSIAVSAFVTANAVVQVEYQAQQLVVTETDVARGYCDAPVASRLRVSSNSRAGYLISIFSRLPIFKSVRVDMPDASAQISRDGGSIAQRRHGKEMLTQMTYRFMLADGVGPGTYPWPLQLDVRPI